MKARRTTSRLPTPADERERLDRADLQAFDNLHGDSKPTGVVDALIRERRREVQAPECHRRA